MKTTYWILLATGLLASTGCSVRYDFTECKSDADCAPFEGGGAFYTCATSTSTCEVAEGVECRSNTDCPAARAVCNMSNKCEAAMPSDMSMDMMPDMVLDMETDMRTECTKDSDCMAMNTDIDAFICANSGQCVSVLSEDCTAVFIDNTVKVDAAAYDKQVFIGSLLPLVEPFGSSIGVPLKNAIELAIREFNRAGGLPDGSKIAWVSCDSKGNAQIATRAANHLATRVGVPAIVGPLFSEETIAVASNVTIPNDILLFTPTATSPEITNLNTNGKTLVWRNIASDVFQGAAFLKRIQDIGVARVLVLYKDDKYGDDLQRQISPTLIQRLGAANVKIAKFDNPITIPDTTERRTKYGSIVSTAMQSFGTGVSPDAVIIIGTSEAAEVGGAYHIYIQTVNARGDMPPLTPGKIVFSHGAVPVMGIFADSLVAAAPPIKPAIESGALLEGIAPDIFDPTTPQYQGFSLVYNTTFNNNEPALASTTSFDAALTILLAMSGIPAGEAITGSKIAAKIPLLVNKDQNATKITAFVTTSYVSEARRAVAMNQAIDLVGVSGELDYDPLRGEVYSRSIGWIPLFNQSSGRYTIKPARVLIFTNPPATNGTWMDLP
jgi:ABC-type branched-subunit amino acid transport system substrate-binding protein